MDGAGDVLRQRCRRRDRRFGRLRERRADVAHAAVRVASRLSEMLCHLAVPADARLGEADEPVGPRQRLLLVAGEEAVDPLRRVGGRVGHLDLHRPAGVEAAPHEPDLLQHPDEDARIGFVAQLLGQHLAPARAAARRRRGGRRRSGMSELREPPQLARVGAAREQQRVRRAAVATGAADHLDVALERLGVVVERRRAGCRACRSPSRTPSSRRRSGSGPR